MKPRKLNVVKELIGLLRAYRFVLAGVLLCLVVLSCLNLAMPKVLKYVLNDVFLGERVVSDRMRLLSWLLGAVVVIYLLRNMLFYMAKNRVMVVGEDLAFRLRQRLISHLHTLSVDFYQQSKPGKISARVMQDVQSIKQFIQDQLASMSINFLMLLVAAGIMLSLDWFLGLITLAVMPCHVVVYCLFRKPIAQYAREAKERIADVSGDLVEQFDAYGAATVRASATQLLEQERFSQSMRMGMRAQIKQSKYYILQKVAADLLVGMGTVVLLGVGGYSVLYRGMSAGEFVEFYGYVGLLYPRLLELVSQAGKFTRTATSVERVFEILHLEPDVRESERAIPHEISQGRIEFRDVSFSYGNGRVLDNVSFSIEPNEHVLVTGPSGSGKTTCVNLIPRFYDPVEGSIRIDGKDVRGYTLTALRRQIGFVFQDCFLFNATIMANIRYAWPTASDQDVVEAASRAYAHEFIEGLPDGYMTLIGEGGIQISQGEKRRLMIARAILKNPKILILDEPLVSLDPEARKRAAEGLSSLLGNRTVLTITHYPAELPHADKLISISDGKVTVQSLAGRVLR